MANTEKNMQRIVSNLRESSKVKGNTYEKINIDNPGNLKFLKINSQDKLELAVIDENEIEDLNAIYKVLKKKVFKKRHISAGAGSV